VLIIRCVENTRNLNRIFIYEKYMVYKELHVSVIVLDGLRIDTLKVLEGLTLLAAFAMD